MLNGDRKLKIRSDDCNLINHNNNLQNENYKKLTDIKNIEKRRPNSKDNFNNKNPQQNNINIYCSENYNRCKPKINVISNNDRMNLIFGLNINNNKNYEKIGKNINKDDLPEKENLIKNLKIINNNNNKNKKIYLRNNIFDRIKEESQSKNVLKIEIKNDNNIKDKDFARSFKQNYNNRLNTENKNVINYHNISERNNNNDQILPIIRRNSYKKDNINLNLLKLPLKYQINQNQNKNYNGPYNNINQKINNINDNNIINIKNKSKSKNNIINIKYEYLVNNLPQISPEPRNNIKSNNPVKLNIKDKKLTNEKQPSKSNIINQQILNNLIPNDIKNNPESLNTNNNNIIELKEEKPLKPDYINNIIPNKNENNILEYYHKEDMNKRFYETMEDFILIKSPFFIGFGHNMSLFAIFDGHGGKDIAEYLTNNFSEQLLEEIQKNYQKSLIEILEQTILDIDIKIKSLKNSDKIGSTGTIVLIDNFNKIYCANVGDSKCYYINNENSFQLSEDHNCKNEKEVELVRKNGGYVFQGRVFGALMLTRVFGDYDFKEFGVTANPYITEIDKNEKNVKFIVLASDGLWDVVDDKLLYKMSLENGNAKELCEKLVDYSLENHSTDNISCIVIKF